jgi:hypothetical protein
MIMDILLASVAAGALATAALMGVLLARLLADERRRSRARIEALRAASGAGGPAAGPDRDLFAEPERSQAWGWRLGAAGAFALVVAAAGFLLLGAGGDGEAAAPGPRAAALELLSLRHEQQNDSLTITGLVQNRKGGAALSGVAATALAFGPDGTFLAGGRAPLDFSTLGPGDESPFVIVVPVKGIVARYRIGFRDPGNRVVAHVDRREAEAAAR